MLQKKTASQVRLCYRRCGQAAAVAGVVRQEVAAHKPPPAEKGILQEGLPKAEGERSQAVLADHALQRPAIFAGGAGGLADVALAGHQQIR